MLATLAEWQGDPASASNVMVLLVAGLIYTSEENYIEALRAVHGGQNLEMCGPSPDCGIPTTTLQRALNEIEVSEVLSEMLLAKGCCESVTR